MQLLKCHTIFDHDHYRCIISIINKNEAINLLQNADLTEKRERSKLKHIYIYIYIFENVYKNGKNYYKV